MVTSSGRASPSSGQSSSNGCMGFVVIIGIVIVLAGLGRCGTSSTTSGNSLEAASTEMTQDLKTAVAAQPTKVVEPLSTPSVARGVRQEHLAFAAEGLSGAMIFSQNCYDALSRSFDWKRLDRCGAADLAASRSVPEGDSSQLEKESVYFDSEAAAQRYLGAATAAGEEAGEADRRLEDLKTRVARAARVVIPSVPERPLEEPTTAPDQHEDGVAAADVVGNA